MFAIVLVAAMIIVMLISYLRMAPVGVANATTTFPGSNGKIVFSRFLGARNIYGEQDLYIMNANGTGLKVLPAADRCNSYPSFSADGRKITFVGLGYNSKVGVLDNSTIYVMNINGTDVRQLTSWTGLLTTPSFSPDGSKIVFVSDGDYPNQEYNKQRSM